LEELDDELDEEAEEMGGCTTPGVSGRLRDVPKGMQERSASLRRWGGM
jgi:hypothetical protein